jgi:hypothetical protein
MSAPVVVLSTGGPVSVNPGQSFEVGVSATDADNRVVVIDFPVQDMAGNTGVARQTINISDPVQIGAPVDVDGVGFTIQAIAAQPGELARFRVTAP